MKGQEREVIEGSGRLVQVEGQNLKDSVAAGLL